MKFHPRDVNERKALEVLVFVAHKCPDLYTALKVIYFADKTHLSRYGRLIFGEQYSAMKDGPVPSYAYDVVKSVDSGDRRSFVDPTPRIKGALSLSGNTITPLREANLRSLSESDVECLREAIEEYGALEFGMLRGISHAQADYNSVGQDDEIPLEAIAKSLPDGEALWSYLNGD